MTYVVCQTPKCQQTYPLSNYKPESVNVPCSKCGGVLIDENGRANMSQHSWVRPVITIEEIEENRKEELARKREQLERLQSEIDVLEQEA